MRIAEWAETYLRHRDLFERKLVRIERRGTDDDATLTLERKDGTRTCRAVGTLSGDPKELLKKDLIITKNLRKNVEYLLKHWALFAAQEGLKIVFANTTANEKWVLIPHSHDQLLDEGPEKGLWALFEGVPEDGQD